MIPPCIFTGPISARISLGMSAVIAQEVLDMIPPGMYSVSDSVGFPKRFYFHRFHSVPDFSKD